MRRKIIIPWLVTVTMSVCLMGCAKQAEQAEQNQETDEAKTESYGTVTLKVTGSEDDQELLAQMVDSFKQKYAGEANFDITIGIQNEAESKDIVLNNVKEAPDVFGMADDQLRTMVAAGVLDKIPDDSSIKSANLEASVEAATVNDTMYAYPMTADNGFFLYYNKAYLNEDDVKTLDRILAVAAENEKKFTMDWTSGWYAYSFFGCTGLEMGLNDDGISNYCNWNSEETEIKGTDILKAMMTISENPGFLSSGDDVLTQGAKDDSVIAGVSGVWLANAMKEAWGDNLGACKLPTYTCAGKEVQMASFSGYKMMGVNAYSKNIEWAHKLAEWITNEENQNLRFEVRGQGPSNSNAATSEMVQQSVAIKALLEQAEFSSLQRVGAKYWEAMASFTTVIALGNPDMKLEQTIMDDLVNAITSSNSL